MRRIATSTVALAALIFASPGSAAEPTRVRVALIDMSAAIGTGMAGRGMRGGQMLPDGWGEGGGVGGWMGPGAMAHGAMLPGMMMGGMMSIRLDHAAVAPGPVRFDVTNWSRSMLHEMLVVAVDESSAPLPYDYARGRVVEDQVHVLGETPELPPNASAELELDLPSGAYVLICNLQGHYAAGMAAALGVTP